MGIAFQDIPVTTPGSRFVLKLHETTADQGAPVVLVLPAMGIRAAFYHRFCADLTGQGFAVATCDLRGHGDSTPAISRSSRFGYVEMVTEDLPAVIDALRTAIRGRTVIVLGHSLGGQLAALYLAGGGPGVDGLVLVGANSVYYRSFPGRLALRTLVASQAIGAVSRLLGYWPGDVLGFGGRQSGPMMRDWARQSLTGVYSPARASIDYEAALAEIRQPILATSLAGDRLAPAEAVDHLCAKLRGAPISRWHYVGEDAGGKPPGHFGWVRRGAPIARRVREWAAEALPWSG